MLRQCAIILFSSARILNAAVPKPISEAGRISNIHVSLNIKHQRVCVCVCLSVTLISQQRKVHLGSWRYRWNWHDKGMLYLEFHAISLLLHAISCNFHTILAIQPFLGQYQHVGYQNACTQAEKCIGNTFKKFHARVHAISRNFHAIWAISAIFGPISTCWVSKSICLS